MWRPAAEALATRLRLDLEGTWPPGPGIGVSVRKSPYLIGNRSDSVADRWRPSADRGRCYCPVSAIARSATITSALTATVSVRPCAVARLISRSGNSSWRMKVLAAIAPTKISPPVAG